MLELSVRVRDGLEQVPVGALVHTQQAVLIGRHQLVAAHTSQSKTCPLVDNVKDIRQKRLNKSAKES